MQANYCQDGRTVSKQLIYTDDKGNDHCLSGRPKLNGLNTTEWWWLQEIMEGPGCEYETSGFAEVFETIVTVPSGDRYNIGEYSEVVMWVEKLRCAA